MRVRKASTAGQRRRLPGRSSLDRSGAVLARCGVHHQLPGQRGAAHDHTHRERRAGRHEEPAGAASDGLRRERGLAAGLVPHRPDHFYLATTRWGSTPDGEWYFTAPEERRHRRDRRLQRAARARHLHAVRQSSATPRTTSSTPSWQSPYATSAARPRSGPASRSGSISNPIATPSRAPTSRWTSRPSDSEAPPRRSSRAGCSKTSRRACSTASTRSITTQPSNGLPGADPVAVTFSSTDPGSGDVTRVCIGGEDPGGGINIGEVLIDPKNSNRSSIECGTFPPTGIFPRELLILAGEAAFQAVFDPLRPATGGVPAGEHPLDATVLAPGFDPGTASPDELARYQRVHAAIQGFADMLGTIAAHETGHALGLVPGRRAGRGTLRRHQRRGAQPRRDAGGCEPERELHHERRQHLHVRAARRPERQPAAFLPAARLRLPARSRGGGLRRDACSPTRRW